MITEFIKMKFLGGGMEFQGGVRDLREKLRFQGEEVLCLVRCGPFPSGERHFSEYPVSRIISRISDNFLKSRDFWGLGPRSSKVV